MKNITKSDVLTLPILLPSLPEQKKIAAFLGAVDEKLMALRKKRDLLADYKRGAMQQIFSQKIRFTKDDGSAFPDWEEKRLGEVAQFFKGRGLSKAEISIDGLTSCIRYAELYTTYGEVIYIVESCADVPVESLFLSNADDVVIPASGESATDIASAACVKRAGVALGGDPNVIRFELILGEYLARYLSNHVKADIAKVAQGNSVVHLYARQLSELAIEIPHPNEQQKIATFLSALDVKIDAVVAQITQMQAFKKGLLQKMFV